jgi:hypothetical protein
MATLDRDVAQQSSRPEDSHRRHRHARREDKKLLGILALSLLQLGFQFLIMKVPRYQFGTLSIGVIALAMLGVAAAALTWGWALNGIASIAGCAFMVGGSMAHGILFVGLAPALLYAGVGAWEYLSADSVDERTRTLAHRGFAVVVVAMVITSVGLSL